MEIISELTRPVIDAAIGLIKWQHSTQMCSAPSHAFLYVLIASSTAIAVGGVYVWRRLFRARPEPQPKLESV